MMLAALGLWSVPSFRIPKRVTPFLPINAKGSIPESTVIPGVWTASDLAKPTRPVREPGQATKARLSATYGKLPLTFEASPSGADSRVRFVSRGCGYNVFLMTAQVVVAPARRIKAREESKSGDLAEPWPEPGASGWLDPEAFRMNIVGSNPAAHTEGLDLIGARSNYFIGSDPAKWRTNISNYARVACRGAYPGIDIIYYGVQGDLEFDFVVSPGADPGVIGLTFEGAQGMRVDSQGDLVLTTAAGEARQHRPVVYQEINGSRQDVAGRYSLRNNHEVGFELAEYDTSKPVVIDPVLSYSTYLGGNNADFASDIAVDSLGNAYVTGTASSIDFPTTLASFQGAKDKSSQDVFVTKLNPAGTAVIYSTYIGGDDNDNGYGIAVDAEGNAYVTGSTSSIDFPTTPGAFQTRYGGGLSNPFVVKLNNTGTALAYSTYVGGPTSAHDSGTRIAIDNQGNAYVTGATGSDKFPTSAGAFQPVFGGGENELGITGTDAFVTKLNSSGTALIYCTYLGGKLIDNGTGIAVDSSGSAYVCGNTGSTDFPTTPGGFQRFASGRSDGFVAKLNPTGSSLTYSTYLGGGSYVSCSGIAVDSSGNAYVTGSTDSTDFPIKPGAFQTALAKGWDVFVTKLNNSGTSLIYSTYLGGSSNENGASIAVDSFGNAYVTGGTSSWDFPVVSPLQGQISSSSSYRTDDGGNTWTPVKVGPPSSLVVSMAIDPINPSKIYAGTIEGIYRSTDGGSTWMSPGKRSPGLGGLTPGALAIDPKTPSTLYAANISGVSKSTDSGDSWTQTALTHIYAFVVAVDPIAPSTIYAGVSFDFGAGIAKSTDGGSTWSITRVPNSGLTDEFITIAIDPQAPSTLYVSNRVDAYTSTDGGGSWTVISGLGGPAGILVVDPANPSTLYASTERGVVKSTDGAVSWAATGLHTGVIFDIAVDPINSSTLYACGYDGVLKSTDGGISWNPAGLVNNTAVALVSHPSVSGRLFVGGELSGDAFVAKLNATGSTLIYSTYFGGSNDEKGAGIAVHSSGDVYVAGSTRSTNLGTTAGVLQARLTGNQNAFIVRISPDNPKITSAVVTGRNLIVVGEGFDKGAVIIIDGEDQRTKNDGQNPKTVLIGKGAAKIIAPGQTVTLRVRNSDGTQAPGFGFTRSSG